VTTQIKGGWTVTGVKKREKDDSKEDSLTPSSGPRVGRKSGLEQPKMKGVEKDLREKGHPSPVFRRAVWGILQRRSSKTLVG